MLSKSVQTSETVEKFRSSSFIDLMAIVNVLNVCKKKQSKWFTCWSCLTLKSYTTIFCYYSKHPGLL